MIDFHAKTIALLMKRGMTKDEAEAYTAQKYAADKRAEAQCEVYGLNDADITSELPTTEDTE